MMRISDLVSMSVRSLWRRKLRTSLTILGVVIGATSIVLMLSLGFAMEKNMEEQFASWGDLTLINVRSFGGDSNSPNLDDAAIKEISKVDHVTHVIPDLSTYLTVTIGKNYSFQQMRIRALDSEQLEALGYKLEEGRLPLDGEENAIVMGKGVLNYFEKVGKKVDWNKMDWANMKKLPFELDDKLVIQVTDLDEKGKPMLTGVNGKIKTQKMPDLKVVGLYGEDNWEVSETIFVSRALYNELVAARQKYEKALNGSSDSAEKKKGTKVTYDTLIVKVDDRTKVTAAADVIKSLGYGNVDTNMEYLEQAQQQAQGKRMALGGMGVVSFFVAAIGIANTMMMSIYERTKEIGVMKVIGAKLKDIKHLFLIEALMIGFIGGAIGAVVSLLLSWGLNAIGEPIAYLMDMPGGTTISIVPPWLVLGAILFSTLVGLISGYFPAKKAMKLSALSAIKTE